MMYELQLLTAISFGDCSVRAITVTVVVRVQTEGPVAPRPWGSGWTPSSLHTFLCTLILLWSLAECSLSHQHDPFCCQNQALTPCEMSGRSSQEQRRMR